MKKQKLILFDWGNIVESHETGYTTSQAIGELFHSLGYPTRDIYHKLSKYHLSSISTLSELEKTYEEMKHDFCLQGDFKDFISRYPDYLDNISYYQDVRDYEWSLKTRCYIGVFSNLTILDKERLDKQLNLENFDYVFLSFEMHCQKPNIEIFEKIQEQHPFSKSDILLIDDSKDNVTAAKEFGWNAIQATGLELDKIIDACEEFIR